MSRGKFEVRGILTTVVEHTTIECTDPSHPAKYISASGNCIGCAYRWLSSLPFFRPYEHEDDLLKVEFGIADDVEWYKKIIKDIWDSEGEGWQGYTAEFFGPKRGVVEDPDEYPYWRIEDEHDPKQLIQLLRMRVCFEPKKQDTPLFLELPYRSFVTSSIRGMDSNIEIGTQDLARWVRVRNRLFNLSGGSSLNLKPARRGRPKGSGSFASKENFLIALRDVLQEADRSLSEPNGLERLSRHQLWQRKSLSLEDSQHRTKTLRNWLSNCGLTWDEAKDKYCQPADVEIKST